MNEFKVDNSLAALATPYSKACMPTAVPAPQWLAFNTDLAAQIQLPKSYWQTDAGLALFSGNDVPDWATPVAHAYAGHQFGHFVPQLGDGRAILLAEVITQNEQRLDLQLKGAGSTPFSRRGDGRSPLGPVLREYLVSEAMHALNVPTTRALAAVITGDWVQREVAEPGAILTRMAKSHFRVGSFQFLANRGDKEELKTFTDYVIQRHYPECLQQTNPYLAFLTAVIDKQAYLIAKWMSIGFIHGVMNTDNMSISGETIDYGPCAFMDNFNPAQVFSYIDSQGRYAWGNQPKMASWNLARFAEALLALIDEDQQQAITLASEAVQGFAKLNEGYFLDLMAKKIGLQQVTANDEALIGNLLQILQNDNLDFSQSFRLLSQNVTDTTNGLTPLVTYTTEWQSWLVAWQQRLAQQDISLSEVKTKMDATNPAIIPRNHIIAKVIQQATTEGDLSLFNQLKQALASPFTLQEADSFLALPPSKDEKIKNTFCGT
ncbi:protein adenylyltransferase SelO [Rheinheimera sp. WS51]|uniref:protein adenylyltransferase SelO n=1 Tax=Rheinheimera sp. WS51 TaxID=3425886 RepID=UPI003D8E2A09